MIDETIHRAGWGWAFNDFRPSYTSRDYREISVRLDAIMLFMEGAGERNSKESLQKKNGQNMQTRTIEMEWGGVKTMETLANIATDLRIVQEPFEELIRSDQTTLVYVGEKPSC